MLKLTLIVYARGINFGYQATYALLTIDAVCEIKVRHKFSAYEWKTFWLANLEVGINLKKVV